MFAADGRILRIINRSCQEDLHGIWETRTVCNLIDTGRLVQSILLQISKQCNQGGEFPLAAGPLSTSIHLHLDFYSTGRDDQHLPDNRTVHCE